MTLIKRRLINVSNRLPVVVKRYAGGPRVERSSGGLASALNSAWQHQPGIWIGCAGTSQNHVDHLLARASRRRSYTLQAVQPPNDEVAKFYSGFANDIIWHLVDDMPSPCTFDPDYCATYQRLIPEIAVGNANPHLVLTHQSHRSIVGTFPISIDFDEFANAAARPEVASRATEIRRELMENILVLGVDRMDYTKGIPERLKS